MQCPKPDCMYLHELGDEAASFTKEEMQVSPVQETTKLKLYIEFASDYSWVQHDVTHLVIVNLRE